MLQMGTAGDLRTFERDQFLPVGIDQAWAFVSNPRNLPRITPSSLDFRIVSPVPERMYDGLTIEYKVRPLLGIPVRWVSLIKDIKAPHRFTDEQVKGPYAFWSHTHILSEVPGGVLMEDVIHYAPPLDGVLPWLNDLVVLPRLKKIFEFRSRTLNELFPSASGGSFPNESKGKDKVC